MWRWSVDPQQLILIPVSPTWLKWSWVAKLVHDPAQPQPKLLVAHSWTPDSVTQYRLKRSRPRNAFCFRWSIIIDNQRAYSEKFLLQSWGMNIRSSLVDNETPAADLRDDPVIVRDYFYPKRKPITETPLKKWIAWEHKTLIREPRTW